LDVTILNRQRTIPVNTDMLDTFIQRLAKRLEIEPATGLGLCLVSDDRMRKFNSQYRGLKRSTDVLSFGGERDEQPDGTVYLGDLVISVQTAARQATETGHSLEHELKLLILHGYLHLLGYDHNGDGGKMMRFQRRLEKDLLPIEATVTSNT
jgi:probable rRNA maturation factor